MTTQSFKFPTAVSGVQMVEKSDVWRNIIYQVYHHQHVLVTKSILVSISSKRKNLNWSIFIWVRPVPIPLSEWVKFWKGQKEVNEKHIPLWVHLNFEKDRRKKMRKLSLSECIWILKRTEGNIWETLPKVVSADWTILSLNGHSGS